MKTQLHSFRQRCGNERGLKVRQRLAPILTATLVLCALDLPSTAAAICDAIQSVEPFFDSDCKLHVDVQVEPFTSCGPPLPPYLIVRVYLDAPSANGGTDFRASEGSGCQLLTPVWHTGPFDIGALSDVWVEIWAAPPGHGVDAPCDFPVIAVHVGNYWDVDVDADGVANCFDNCLGWDNPAQDDWDGDGLGDACDPDPFDDDEDTDEDGVDDAADNCPNAPNADQSDGDGDGLGDVCDPNPVDPGGGTDSDGDGQPDALDNCPATPNPSQADADGDGIGDACDPDPAAPYWDPDNDGLHNAEDNCPADANPDQSDGDGDGVGNVCDAYPTFPGTFNYVLSSSFTVLNRALPTVTFQEAVSRSASVINYAIATPSFTESISRSASVLNYALATPTFSEAISRAATVTNSCFGDLDNDGDIDLADFQLFANGFAVYPALCGAGDLDGDATVDLDDAAIFVAAMTGPE